MKKQLTSPGTEKRGDKIRYHHLLPFIGFSNGGLI